MATGAPAASRVICQAVPSKTHQRATWTPLAARVAKRPESCCATAGSLTPPLATQPKSQPQLTQGTLTPCRYQGCPCQGMRQPTGGGAEAARAAPVEGP